MRLIFKIRANKNEMVIAILKMKAKKMNEQNRSEESNSLVEEKSIQFEDFQCKP